MPTVSSCTIRISSHIVIANCKFLNWGSLKGLKVEGSLKESVFGSDFLLYSGEQCRYIGSNYLIFLFVFWEITPTNLPQDTFQNNNNLFNFFSRMLHNGSVKGDERPHIFILCNSVLHL